MVNNISFGSMFRMGGFSETKETKKEKEKLSPYERLIQEGETQRINEINRQILQNQLAMSAYLKEQEEEEAEKLKAKKERFEAEKRLSELHKEEIKLRRDSETSWENSRMNLLENREIVVDAIKRAPNKFKAVKVVGDRENTLYIYDENINTLTIYYNEIKIEEPIKSYDDVLFLSSHKAFPSLFPNLTP